MPIPRPRSNEPSPLLGEPSEPVAHLHGHAHALGDVVVDWPRVVEEDHHAVAGEMLQRPAVGHDDRAELTVVFPEDVQDLLWLRGFRERGEATEVAEHAGDLAPVAGQELLAIR